MKTVWFLVAFTGLVGSFFYGLSHHKSLVFHTISKEKAPKSNASAIISMGRDDDDGKALKWHVGGGES